MKQTKQMINSDLSVMISHINAMLEQMAGCVNTIATQSLSLAIAVESTTLTQKLQEMMGRWKDYIPFHECSDVNFHYWHVHLLQTYSAMKCSRAVQDGAYVSPHHPDAPFRLDLLADFKRMRKRTGGEMETTVKHYVQYTDELLAMLSAMSVADDRQCRAKLDSAALKTLHSQYDDYLCMVLKAESQLSDMDLEMKIKPWMNTYFKVLAEQPFMVYCIDMAMDNLLTVLQQIDDFFNSEFSDEQFQCLTYRLYFRHCPDAQTIAKQELRRWTSEWPSLRRKERAQQKREELLAEIRQRYDKPALDDYIDMERPNPLTDTEFGRFLFASRTQMSHEDVTNLFLHLFRIHELNRLIDPEGVEADLSAAHLSAARKEIYHRLTDLVRKAEWQGGMTPERIHHILSQILMPQGGTPALCRGNVNISDIFWNLLMNRRGCDTDFRSLKLTWLNLVGYFCSRGYLKGGSPALCRYFFPDGTPEGQHNVADYNAVTKGSGDRAGNDFHDLTQVLDTLLASDPQK